MIFIKKVWKELRKKRESSNTNIWCVLGDFNSVKMHWERVGLSREGVGRREREEFNIFVSDMELEDIAIVGRRFTWYRPNERAKSKTNRVLLPREWLNTWLKNKQHILNRRILGHCAVLLKDDSIDWGPKPFKTLDCWLEDRRFGAFVKETWGVEIQGYGAYVLKEKLKLLKLKAWNKNQFGNIQKRQKLIEEEMNCLDKKEEEDKFWTSWLMMKRLSALNYKRNYGWLW